MSLMAENEESDPSAILNGFWVTLLSLSESFPAHRGCDLQKMCNFALCTYTIRKQYGHISNSSAI